MKSEFNLIIAGLGGQGVISAGHILSEAAIMEGLNFKTFGSYGMAQRGGSVCLHFRVGDVHSPRILEGSCDILVGFEFIEGLRNSYFVNRSGMIVLNRQIVLPPSANDLKVDAQEMADILRKRFKNTFILDIEGKMPIALRKGLNSAMLGACFALGLIPISIEKIRDSIASHSQKRRESNLEAFEFGYRALTSQGEEE